jgi:hypothetical protein
MAAWGMGAGAGVQDGDAELERDAGLVLGDAGDEELVGDVERAYLPLGDEGAGGAGGGECEGVLGQAQGGGEGVGEEAAAGELDKGVAFCCRDRRGFWGGDDRGTCRGAGRCHPWPEAGRMTPSLRLIWQLDVD